MRQRYEVKVVIEYWVCDVYAENEDDAREQGYMEYEDWMETGTLVESKAYVCESDDDTTDFGSIPE